MAIKIIKEPNPAHRVFQIKCHCGCVFECDETDINTAEAKYHPYHHIYGSVVCPHCGLKGYASSENMVYDSSIKNATGTGVTQYGRSVGYFVDGEPVSEKPHRNVWVDEDKLNSII